MTIYRRAAFLFGMAHILFAAYLSWNVSSVTDALVGWAILMIGGAICLRTHP